MRHLLLMALGTACLPAEPMTEVRLQGEVRSPQQGAIELWLMHTRAGEGLLETPLAIISTWTLEAPGALDWTVLVPSDAGEGLSLYAWQDANGDGAHCLPGTPIESAKTIELSSPNGFGYAIELNLEPSCDGPTPTQASSP